jgi:hypothetical protein
MKTINPMMAIAMECFRLLAMLLLFEFCCQSIVQAQDPQIVIPDSPQVIADKITPMEYAADVLEHMYLKPVTYEDPILSWSGDIGQVPNGIGKMLNIPKRRSFEMPIEAHPSKTPTLDVGLLKRVVDAYQDQTDGPRFRVESSRWGLHLIPDQVRDRSGRFVGAINFLDTFISIPVEKRTPARHFQAICDAINASMVIGVKLLFAPQYLDAYFSQIRISRFPTEAEMEQISFSWGIEQMTARDALIDLLEQSASTMTWRLLCDTQPSCALNIVSTEVDYMDGKPPRRADHDRKKQVD